MENEYNITLEDIEHIIGSKEKTLFYLTWLKHNRNGTRAYMELHPEVKESSARVLASNLLSTIDINLIADCYGLNHQKYYEMLQAGLEAEKRDQYTGEMYPDHQTRLKYLDKLGKLLRIEREKEQQKDEDLKTEAFKTIELMRAEYNLEE
ncbi:MAG TPA: hypothetical protein PLX95_03900 [bacterium]|nr:hypothetical protein [bacterium]